MVLNLNPRAPQQNVRVTTDLDRVTADRLHGVVGEMGCTRAEFMRSLVHAYLKERDSEG